MVTWPTSLTPKGASLSAYKAPPPAHVFLRSGTKQRKLLFCFSSHREHRNSRVPVCKKTFFHFMTIKTIYSRNNTDINVVISKHHTHVVYMKYCMGILRTNSLYIRVMLVLTNETCCYTTFKTSHFNPTGLLISTFSIDSRSTHNVFRAMIFKFRLNIDWIFIERFVQQGLRVIHFLLYRVGQYFKYTYLKYVFEIPINFLYLNTMEIKSNVFCI